MQLNDLLREPDALAQSHYQDSCQRTLARDGVLVLEDFLQPEALSALRAEALERADQAYFSTQQHNVYLAPSDAQFDDEHPRNRRVTSSKGCITDDQIGAQSPLRALYNSHDFQRFLCAVLQERQLFPYADPQSSINVHYAQTGQELGWHFDNSSFAITLMIEAAASGGDFEYVGPLRDADAQQMNYAGVARVLDGETAVQRLSMQAGALVLFRGRNTLHRVSPNTGPTTRLLAVLAYNTEAGVCLSESARQTFYGRVA